MAKLGRPRKTIAKTYLESVVLDTTMPPPLRLKAAIVLLDHETDAKAPRRPSAMELPLTWAEAKAAEGEL